jgi:hypothetical protein
MTDFRALCAELVEDIEEWLDGTDHCPPSSVALVNRARAALAQPEPPSKAAQAEALIERHEDGWMPSPSEWHIIREGLAEGRRALEQLPE